MQKKIGAFDSGVGRATTAAEIQKYFPQARLIDGNRGVAKRVRDLITS